MNYSATEIADAMRDVCWQIEHDVGGVCRASSATTSRVVRLAVELWPPIVPLPYGVATPATQGHAASTRSIKARIRQQYEERYGMGFLATIILSAVISQVVQAIIRRWWGNTGSFRKQMRLAQYGMANQ